MTNPQPPRRRKIAVLYSHPIQYFAPLLRAIAGAHDLVCYFYSEEGLERGMGYGTDARWDLPLRDGYRSEIPANLGQRLGFRGFFAHFNPGLLPALAFGRYDAVVVNGYFSASSLLGIVAAKLGGARVLLRGDSNKDRPMSPRKALAKRAILTALFRLIDGALVVGRKNAAYYRRFGLPAERCFPMPYSVETERFVEQARTLAPQRRELRAGFSATDDDVLLVFAGRFAPEKAVDTLLNALARVAPAQRLKLLLVGDGPLRAALAEQVARLGLEGRVVFAGFLNQTRIGEAYAAADAFVLPSSWEPWGLVVNEAMCFGLPCLVSAEAGCSDDLVLDGVNGLVLPAGDLAAWAAALSHICGDAARARMADAARATVERWSIERSVDGLSRALAQLLDGLDASSR